jgi:Sulfotransferase family
VTKLVYIGGYGHSGSTLLEYLLAASPEVVACGEVVSVLRERGRKAKCTCRRKIEACPVWGPLFASTEILDGMTHEELARALVAQDGGAHAILVDSSKTAWRSAAAPFRLARALGEDFRLVHLVRDPRAVSWSAVKKSGRRGGRPLVALRSASATLGWWVANLACERFGRAHPEAYLRLRYEDLARTPHEAMRRLLAELLPGSEWRAEDIGGSDNRHQLYGNRMRSAQLSLAEIREDVAWTRDMPPVYRSLVSFFTAPLRRRYGYA